MHILTACKTIFFLIMQMSLIGSLIAVVLLVLRHTALERIPKKYLCLLWFLLVFRLICPFVPEGPISQSSINKVVSVNDRVVESDTDITHQTIDNRNWNLPDSNNLNIHNPNDGNLNIHNPNDGNLNIHSTNDSNNNISNSNTDEPNTDIANDSDAINNTQASKDFLIYILISLYFVGVIAFIVYMLLSYRKLKRKLIGSVLLKNTEVIYLTGRKAKVPVWECTEIASPFVTGIFKPAIYMPSDISESQFIFAHELAHIRRGDIVLKLFMTAALAIHWFNPIIWFAIIDFQKDIEMACDEYVLAHYDDDIKKDYANTLLQYSAKRSGISLFTGFGESNTEKRIKNILKYKKPGGVVTIIALMTIAVFFIIFGLKPNSGEEAVSNTDTALNVTQNATQETTQNATQETTQNATQAAAPNVIRGDKENNYKLLNLLEYDQKKGVYEHCILNAELDKYIYEAGTEKYDITFTLSDNTKVSLIATVSLASEEEKLLDGDRCIFSMNSVVGEEMLYDDFESGMAIKYTYFLNCGHSGDYDDNGNFTESYYTDFAAVNVFMEIEIRGEDDKIILEPTGVMDFKLVKTENEDSEVNTIEIAGVRVKTPYLREIPFCEDTDYDGDGINDLIYYVYDEEFAKIFYIKFSSDIKNKGNEEEFRIGKSKGSTFLAHVKGLDVNNDGINEICVEYSFFGADYLAGHMYCFMAERDAVGNMKLQSYELSMAKKELQFDYTRNMTSLKIRNDEFDWNYELWESLFIFDNGLWIPQGNSSETLVPLLAHVTDDYPKYGRVIEYQYPLLSSRQAYYVSVLVNFENGVENVVDMFYSGYPPFEEDEIFDSVKYGIQHRSLYKDEETQLLRRIHELAFEEGITADMPYKCRSYANINGDTECSLYSMESDETRLILEKVADRLREEYEDIDIEIR